MRNLINICIFLSTFLLISSVYGNDNKNELVELNDIAKNLKEAVIREDGDLLMQYVSPSGTYFIDSVYTFAEIKELLRTKNSWLYKHLFSGENSVKKYFQDAENLKIKIHRRNNEAIFISYQSSNYDSIKWVECCFIKINAKWYFDGIFSCE